MLTYPAFGIELSDGALKAVKLQRRGTRLVVTWAKYRPYARAEDGAVRPRAGLSERAREALRQFLVDARPGHLDRIYVGLPSVATFNRLIRVPDVGEERLREIARYEAHRSLRGPIDDYVVRTRILKRRSIQEEIPCLLFAVRRSLRDAFVTDLSSLGLEFDNMIPSPAALALFVRYDRPAAGDRIVVSIGLRATEVVYMRDRGHAYRTLPLGVVGLAEMAAANEARARAATRRLVEKIGAEIGKGSSFFFGKEGGIEPEAVTLFGEGAVIPEVVEGFRRLYPGKVESVGSLRRIVVDPAVEKDQQEYVAQMGSALGLAIAAARAEDPQIELMERNRARDAARRFPGIAVAVLILSLVAFFAAQRDVAEAERISAIEVTPEAEDIRSRTDQEADCLRRAGELAAWEEGIARFAPGRAARATLLATLVRNFGPSIVDYGQVDLRLGECRILRDPDGAQVEGKALTPLVEVSEVRAPTTLRQRLLGPAHLLDVAVEEVEAERDPFTETTVYSFRGHVQAGSGR